MVCSMRSTHSMPICRCSAIVHGMRSMHSMQICRCPPIVHGMFGMHSMQAFKCPPVVYGMLGMHAMQVFPYPPVVAWEFGIPCVLRTPYTIRKNANPFQFLFSISIWAQCNIDIINLYFIVVKLGFQTLSQMVKFEIIFKFPVDWISNVHWMEIRNPVILRYVA